MKSFNRYKKKPLLLKIATKSRLKFFLINPNMTEY